MPSWLIKADPDDYGWQELARDGETTWDGVRNPLALRHLRAMRAGDACFVYETGDVRAVVATARVVAPAAAAGDPAGPRLAAGRRLARPIPMAEIRADPAFAELPLVRQGRLSAMPVPAALARRLLALGKEAR